jgi:hypothetical protein
VFSSVSAITGNDADGNTAANTAMSVTMLNSVFVILRFILFQPPFIFFRLQYTPFVDKCQLFFSMPKK